MKGGGRKSHRFSELETGFLVLDWFFVGSDADARQPVERGFAWVGVRLNPPR